MITDINQLDLSKRYTYADYLTWQFDDMVELIGGKIFKMSPAPSRMHQEVSSNLSGIIWSYLKKRPCKIFSAPFDVRLPLPPDQQKKQKIDTVVQPDICVICDIKKLDDHGCNGAPDWVIEILSPKTSQKDLTEKFDIYQHAGVREYWVVHPSECTVIPYRMDSEGQYQLLRKTPFVKGENVPVGVFSDLNISLNEVFLDDEN
ncbi:MAG: Uma2 family endonuclease [Saprospiraceae bacterium]|jgi:Uma2 family endonuclease